MAFRNDFRRVGSDIQYKKTKSHRRSMKLPIVFSVIIFVLCRNINLLNYFGCKIYDFMDLAKLRNGLFENKT